MLVQADARFLPIASNTIQCCVTSPPYWGLRDYGVSGQLGLDPTPDAYVASMVEVFREVWRVLRDDGTLWLNLGDSYHNVRTHNNGGVPTNTVHVGGSRDGTEGFNRENRNKRLDGLKEKDLVGIPWRVAFGLQADGWYLRSDIIWSKPNPMPESVTDRPTKAHEYMFLLTKSQRYYYDTDAIREAHKPESLARYEYGLNVTATADGYVNTGAANPRAIGHCDRMADNINPLGRNRRSVWTVNTQPYREAHFAVMPERLVEPCIKAGSRPGDLVLDPFAGSGTVGVVARKWCRRFVGTELNPSYLAMARRRLTNVQQRLADL